MLSCSLSVDCLMSQQTTRVSQQCKVDVIITGTCSSSSQEVYQIKNSKAVAKRKDE